MIQAIQQKSDSLYSTGSSHCSNDLDARLKATLELHLHPKYGSPYWWRRQENLGINVLDRVRCIGDLALLGPTRPAELSTESVWNFLPRHLWNSRSNCVIGESGGTSGPPTSSVYLPADFHTAFVSPFVWAARQTSFPKGCDWLWVGPSGPHIIGKVVRKLAMSMGSPDPWSVDFDPRWVKKLIPGSFVARRYLAHVIDQVGNILERENPEVLFTTPPVLDALATRLDDDARSQFRGIHYGGMTITAEQINGFRKLYPNAVHLSGYGNSLCGVAMEIHNEPRTSIDYYPRDARLIYDVVRMDSDETAWTSVEPGERGRVIFHRLDESTFLPNVIERDEASLILPTPDGYGAGWMFPGLRDPGPSAKQAKTLKLGLY